MSARARVVLVAILGLGATLRLWTIGEGLPYLPGVDEPVIFNRVAEMMRTGDLHPHIFDYGGLIFYFHLAIAWVRFAAGSLTGSMPELSQVAASDFFLWGRVATALIGTATIYVVFRAASRWGLAAGLLAAAAIAVHPQLVRESHFALTDTPLVFCVALTLLFSLRAAESGGYAAYAWAGVFAGLATGIKLPGGLAGLMPLGALITTVPPRRWLGAAASLFGAAAGAFLLVNPYTLIDFKGFVTGLRNLQEYYNDPSSFSLVADVYRKHIQSWFTWPGHLSRDYGLPALLVTALGLVAIATGIRARDGRARAAVLLAFPVAYFVFIANQSLLYGRYAMPVLPIVAIGLATGMVRIYDVVARRAAIAAPAARGLLLLLFVPPLLSSIGFNRGQEPLSTNEQLTAWMERTVKPDELVLLERRFISVSFPERRFKLREVTRLIDDPLEKHRADGAVYLIWSNWNQDDLFKDPTTYGSQIAAYNALLRDCELVQEFTTGDPVVRILRVR